MRFVIFCTRSILEHFPPHQCRKLLKKSTTAFNDTLLAPYTLLLGTLDKIFSALKIYDLEKQGRKVTKIVHYFKPVEISNLKTLISNFALLWRSSDLGLSTEGLKIHLLCAHLVPTIERYGFSPAYVSEQDLESCHSRFDKGYKNYNSSDKRLLNYMIEFNGLQM